MKKFAGLEVDKYMEKRNIYLFEKLSNIATSLQG